MTNFEYGSADERKVCDEFRAFARDAFEKHRESHFVEELKVNDSLVHRFLKAGGYKFDKTLALLETTLAWRHDEKVDHIHHERFEKIHEIKEVYAHCFHKFDKRGRPIYIERTGQLDVTKLMEVTTLDEMVRLHVNQLEFMRRELFPLATKRSGANTFQLCSIVDLKGLGTKHLSKVAYNYLTTMSTIDEAHFPEILGKLYIINAPMLFSVVWSIVKPLLRKSTRDRIEVVRGNYLPKLLEDIDEDSLPDFLGGKCRCDAGCQHGAETEVMARDFALGRSRAPVPTGKFVLEERSVTRSQAETVEPQPEHAVA